MVEIFMVEQQNEAYGREFKGGVGGKSPRMRERFTVETPSAEPLNAYFVKYLNEDLRSNPIDLIPPTSESLFGNQKPLVVDLGCGRGEFVLSEAYANPNNNYVGIDFHTRSLYLGVHVADHLKLENVKFLRADIRQFLQFIPTSSVEQVSVLFPAPIISPKFKNCDVLNKFSVAEISRILKQGGKFIFVSDAEGYFSDKLSLIDLELFEIINISKNIENPVTRYQKQWQSKGIPSNRVEMIKK